MFSFKLNFHAFFVNYWQNSFWEIFHYLLPGKKINPCVLHHLFVCKIIDFLDRLVVSKWYIENTSWKGCGIYAWVVDVSEIERVRFLIQKQQVVLCLLYTYWDIQSSFWPPFYFSSFQNAKIYYYTPPNNKEIEVSAS